MEQATYTNQYGTLTISNATKFMAFRQFSLLDIPTDCHLDDITATKVERIVAGRGCTVVYYGGDKAYILMYDNMGNQAVAKIEKLDYIPTSSLTTEYILSLGFTFQPFPVLGGLYVYDLGRNRQLTLSGVGTGNEMMYISELENGQYTNSICIHNFDYNGFLTEFKLHTIVQILA